MHIPETVTMFAVEDEHTIPLIGGMYGAYLDNGDALVKSDSQVDEASNVWVHEYVHSRQGFETGSNMSWFVEGSAEYYAA